MKFLQRFLLFFFVATTKILVANAAERVLELRPLPDSAWGEDWSGGCWFHKEFNWKRGDGGQLMFLIRGEREESSAVFDLDGELIKIPYTQTIAKRKRFRMGARETYLYQAGDMSVQVTTVVTEVPEGNECAGDCSESSGFAAEIKIQSGKAVRKYKFKTGACGL
ncbi:MAG: hypothetical protein K2X55_02395 [Burkholderiaceae bacterium]|nr:hypothetical protein [Burkholderiaceae bacterium]